MEEDDWEEGVNMITRKKELEKRENGARKVSRMKKTI